MMAQLPDEIKNAKSAESIQGDVAHHLAAQFIDSARRAKLYDPVREETVGTIISSIVVTDEMFDACKLYSDDVSKVMRETHTMGAPFLGIEERVSIFMIHKTCCGTPDLFLYDHKNKILYIWDFKYGHSYVDEYENWQGIPYAAGVIARLVPDGFTDPDLRVCIRIVQPRAYGEGGPIREWSIKAVDLLPYVEVMAINAAISLSADAKCHTGPHCKNCKARHGCEAALRAGMLIYECASAPVLLNMTPEAMSTQYAIIERAQEQLGCLETGFKEQIKHLLKSGKIVPGYNLEPHLGRECWTRPAKEIISIGDMLGADLRNIKAITPNQARKQGVDAATIKEFSEYPKKGLKLVKSNNKFASKIFS